MMDNDIITTSTYDAAGRMKFSYDPLGRQSEAVYDDLNRVSQQIGPNVPGLGRPISTFAYDVEGRQMETTDTLNRVMKYEYDNLGRRDKVTFADGATHTPISEYDIRGRVTRQLDQRGNATEFFYDASGRQVAVRDALGNITRTQYDVAGNRVATMDALGRITKFAYDAIGRMTETEFPAPDPFGVAPANQPTFKRMVYDKRGQVVKEYDQNQVAGGMEKFTKFEYDTLGRLVEVHDPLNGSDDPWVYEYDEAGNQTKQTDPLDRETTWTYDEHGRRKTRTLPMGQMEEMFYNKAGNLVTHKKFDGSEIHYEYDKLNRQIARDYPSGTAEETATFDLAGQRLSTNDAYGQRSFEYDLRGRLTKVNHPTDEAISYRYDDMGNRVAVFTLDNGTTLTAQSMTYDELNRLKTVTVDGQGTWTYEYNDVGVRTALVSPNYTKTQYDYDQQYRLKRLHTFKYWPTEVDLLDLHYTVDAVGNRTLITEKIAGVTIAETAYEYDDLYRLTKETRTVSLSYSREYAYDEVGNRQSQTTITGAVTEIKTYHYNDKDQLTTETIGSQVIAYEYDANGSMIEKDDSVEGITTYTWDARDKLVAAQAPGEPLVQMTYDSDGSRVSKTLSSGTTTTTTLYLVDVNNGTGYSQVIRETDGSANEQVHYFFGDDLLAQIRDSQVRHYHYDGLGTTRVLSDENGGDTDAYAYYGFGELLTMSGISKNDFLYTGKQYDQHMRFYYLRARYFDPSAGALVSLDSYDGALFYPRTLHKYLYSMASPITRTDPSGHLSMTELLLGAAIIAHIAAIASVELGFFQESNVQAVPDAGVLGASGQVPWELFVGIARFFMPSISMFVPAAVTERVGVIGGMELVMSIASGQTALFAYGGAYVSTGAFSESFSLYSGVVYKLWNIKSYEGASLAGVKGLGHFGPIGFLNPRAFAEGLNSYAAPWGFGLARNWPAGSSAQVSITNYRMLDVINHSSMYSMIPVAATWGSTTSMLFGYSNWMKFGGWAAIASSYWPYAKWKSEDALRHRQTTEYNPELPEDEQI